MKNQKQPIDYQLDYMEHLFYSIKHKKTESYVIHRIWDKLDDTRIRFVVQQRVELPHGNMLWQTCIFHKSESSLKSTSLSTPLKRKKMTIEMKTSSNLPKTTNSSSIAPILPKMENG